MVATQSCFGWLCERYVCQLGEACCACPDTSPEPLAAEGCLAACLSPPAYEGVDEVDCLSVFGGLQLLLPLLDHTVYYS